MLRGAKHGLDPVDASDHSPEVWPVSQVVPVRPDAAREIAAATYIDDAAQPIAKQVDTRLMRKQAKHSRNLGYGRR